MCCSVSVPTGGRHTGCRRRQPLCRHRLQPVLTPAAALPALPPTCRTSRCTWPRLWGTRTLPACPPWCTAPSTPWRRRVRLLPAAVACSSCLPALGATATSWCLRAHASGCASAVQQAVMPSLAPIHPIPPRPRPPLPLPALPCTAVAAGLRGPAGDAPDAYLGLLSTEDDLRLFGFLSNTRVKLVVAVDDPVVKDDEMRAVRLPLPLQPDMLHFCCSRLCRCICPYHCRCHCGLGWCPACNPLASILPHTGLTAPAGPARACRFSGACWRHMWMQSQTLSTL
jgi:hypothetical protein